MDIIYLLFTYAIIMNLIGFVIMGYDKRKAINHQWRISEKTIFILGFLGGCIGILLGMNLFHHKTKHKKFTYGIPGILLLQLIIIMSILKVM